MPLLKNVCRTISYCVFYLDGLTREKIGWLIDKWVDAAGQCFNGSRGRCVLSKDTGRCNPEFIRLQRKCPQVELTFLVEGSRELSTATPCYSWGNLVIQGSCWYQDNLDSSELSLTFRWQFLFFIIQNHFSFGWELIHSHSESLLALQPNIYFMGMGQGSNRY